MNQSFCAATVNSVMPGVGLSVCPGAKHCVWYITENQEIVDEEMKGKSERGECASSLRSQGLKELVQFEE